MVKQRVGNTYLKYRYHVGRQHHLHPPDLNLLTPLSSNMPVQHKFSLMAMKRQASGYNIVSWFPHLLEGIRPLRCIAQDFGYHIITVPEGAVVDIVVYNSFMTSIHPLHLHGHWMWVMGRGLPGAGPFNASTYVPSSQPTLRDTATVSENSWTVLRFVADNPGTWLFHCHIGEQQKGQRAKRAGRAGSRDR